MNHQDLPFLERLPRDTSLGKPPLLVLLHGRAAEAKTIFSIEGLLDPRLHVLSIRAPYESELGGFEWFHPGTDETREEIKDAKRFDESEGILTKIIQSHITRLGMESNDLFLWGFSQGAAMSLILGLRGKLKPKGVVPMSGFLPTPVKRWKEWSTESKYLIAHGTNDEVLSADSSLAAKSFLESKGIEVEYHEFKGRHKMTLDSIAYINNWIKKIAKLP